MKVSVTLAAIAMLLVAGLIYQTEAKKREQRAAMSEPQASIYEVPLREVTEGEADRVAMGRVTQR